MRPFSPIGRITLLTFTAAALAACTNEPLAPTRLSAPTSAHHDVSASGTGAPSLTPNGVKYRDQTYKHASARSGNATVTARALLGKDGNTSLEVTTGALDVSTAAPGNMVKVQTKLESGNQQLQATLNHDGLTGGYHEFDVAGRPAHSWIQVQSNVRDIDPHRTDVVTVLERVNKRPDITVSALTAPDTAKINTQVVISSTIAELNGDVGAHTNCVLYVNGAQADQANGIWVANGDQVTCAFTRSFATAATYDLEVRAESVVPGDWDTSNNSASRKIVIVNPEVQLHGSAYAAQSVSNYGWNYTDSWSDSYGNQQYQDSQLGHSESQGAVIYASAPQTVSFPLASVSITQSSGGATLSSITATDVGANGYGCVYLWANGGADWANICGDVYNNGTSVYAGHFAGSVTYYSQGYQRGWDWYDGNYSWSWNNSSTYDQYGTFTPFGADYTFDVNVTDASGTTFLAHPVISLSSQSVNYDTGWSCFSHVWYRNDLYCEQIISNGTYTSGSASF